MALIAAWNFDEAAGDALDVTGNGHDFTPTDGDASRTGAGHTDGGLAFSGAGGAGPTIVAPAIGESTDRTVMMWLKLDSTPGVRWPIIWYVSSIDSGAWGILLLSGNIHIQARSSTEFARATGTAPTDEAWHHIAGTYTESTSTIELFVDGVSVDTTALTGPLRTDADTLILGSADGEPFTCDDLRIYDEALDQAAIETAMDTPVTGGAFSGTATVTGSGTLTAGGAPEPVVSPGLAGSGSLTATGTPDITAPAGLPGTGSLTIIGIPGVVGAVAEFAGSATLTTDAPDTTPLITVITVRRIRGGSRTMDAFFVGQAVPLRFLMFDADGEPADPTSYSLTMRLPDGTTEALVATNPEVGDWRHDYYPTVFGRFVATFVATGAVSDAVEDTFDVAPAAAAMVTLTQLRTYLGDGAAQWDDDELTTTLAAEQSSQARACRIDPYSLDLLEALKRRVARNLAMRKVPLGVSVSEVDATRIGGRDPEVRRLEGNYRRVSVG
jgi:hypothetical protein